MRLWMACLRACCVPGVLLVNMQPVEAPALAAVQPVQLVPIPALHGPQSVPPARRAVPLGLDAMLGSMQWSRNSQCAERALQAPFQLGLACWMP